MKCPECVKEGRRSYVYPDQYVVVTDVPFQPFYDPDGNYHSHDPNPHGSGYSCSEGHRWHESRKVRCRCGWPDEGPYTGLPYYQRAALSPTTPADADTAEG